MLACRARDLVQLLLELDKGDIVILKGLCLPLGVGVALYQYSIYIYIYIYKTYILKTIYIIYYINLIIYYSCSKVNPYL